MADETETQSATPANRGGKAPKTVLIRLISAGINDVFIAGDDLMITTQGTEVPESEAERLLELGAQHGAQLTYDVDAEKE